MEYALLALCLLLILYFFDGFYEYSVEKKDTTRGGKLPDIETAIVDLIAVSMRADGVVSKMELARVKSFLLKGFGEERARSLLVKLRDTLKNKHITDIRRQCVQINRSLSYRQKLALVNLFLAIASVESLQKKEVQFIQLFARYTRVTSEDLGSLRSRYFSDSQWDEMGNDEKDNHQDDKSTQKSSSKEEAYRVLGLTSDADMQQVKRAYRKLVMQWHPDLFTSKSADELKQATSKFREINQAYKTICETS